MGKIFSSN